MGPLQPIIHLLRPPEPCTAPACGLALPTRMFTRRSSCNCCVSANVVDVQGLLAVNPLLPKEGARRVGTRGRPGLEFWHPELRGCRVLRTLGDALQARDELDAVLHTPNQTGTANRTAWNAAVERCLRPRTPIAQAPIAQALYTCGNGTPAVGQSPPCLRTFPWTGGGQPACCCHSRLKLGRGWSHQWNR